MHCIFCDIVSGKMPSFSIWEDEQHTAFLSIFPNTKGVTVVIPKQHWPSDALALPPAVLSNLTQAAQKVAGLLTRKFADVGRTALVYEGFGVDHVHAKLFPMHGTCMESWRPIHKHVNHYSDVYEGYISTHDGKRAHDDELEALATYLRC